MIVEIFEKKQNRNESKEIKMEESHKKEKVDNTLEDNHIKVVFKKNRKKETRNKNRNGYLLLFFRAFVTLVRSK